MSFWLFIVCIEFALFFGAVIDRVVVNRDLFTESHKDYTYYSVAYKNKEDAIEILETLKKILALNKVVRVYDIYVMSNIETSVDDVEFGWTDISEFTVEPTDNSRWIIKVTKPVVLEK